MQALFNILSAGPPKTEFGETKKKAKDKRLKRPIICICNDAWGPALRDLRKIAMIVNFPVTQSARLAYRLKSICNIEQLTADMATLLYLCEKTDNDIRLLQTISGPLFDVFNKFDFLKEITVI